MAVSNNITGALNLIAVVLSVPIIAAGIWLATKEDNVCVRFLRWPAIVLGVILLLVSLAGFVGAFWRIPWLLVIYLIFMFTLILLLLALVIFSFVVTSKGGGHSVPNRNYEEYQLGDFSARLRHYVQNTENWNRIRNCLGSSNLCTHLAVRYANAQDFFNARINPLQSGCCKPPSACGYTFVSPTYWTNPTNPNVDNDCLLWSNDQMQLCYNCDSCRAGLLGNVKREWRKVDVILIVVLVSLIWVYLIGCSAFRNAQTEALFRRFKEGYM